MTKYFGAKKTACWLLAGLLGTLASCGSTREVTASSPSSTVIGSARSAASADYATVRASQPAGTLPVRTVTMAPLPVLRPQPRRPDPEPAGPSSAIAAPSAVLVAVPSRTSSTKSVTKVTRTQAGRIIDEAGQPLVGATVLLKGTTRGASTDANGNYSLEVPAGTNTFIFGYSGYQDEVAESRDGQPLTVTLLPNQAAAAAAPVLEKRRQRLQTTPRPAQVRSLPPSAKGKGN